MKSKIAVSYLNMNKRVQSFIFLCALSVGLVLRLWNLSGPDINSDDALYSLRSIGYIDYVASTNKQSTPVTWFDKPVWWQRLSFHDAPPLVFAAQWISFQLFGDNAIGARLPFVAAGMLALYGAYLAGTLIAGSGAGLVAAGMLAISNYAIWISRIGYLDGFLVPAILFSLYFFIKAKNAPKHYLWWGIAVGAGLLIKYTFLFMGPMFLVALLTFRREALKKKWFYYGCAAIILLLSPVILYNVMMYATRGHFDAALSTLVGLHPDDFKGLTREARTHFNPATIAATLLRRNTSIGVIALLLAALFAIAYDAWKNRERRANYALLGLGGFWALVMLGIISASDHFGAVLLPFVALTIGAGVAIIGQSIHTQRISRRAYIAALIAIGLWEVAFAAETQLTPTPFTQNPLFYAKNTPSFAGFAELERYVEQFYDTYPELSTFVIFADAPQLAAYQEPRILKRLQRDPNQPLNSHLLVFDDRMKWFAWVWIFERRRLYDFSPIPSLTQFSEKLRAKGINFYRDLGFTDVTFITAADASVMDATKPDDERTKAIAEIAAVTEPIHLITNAKGITVFRIYRMKL